jgi:peroxiredoxin
LRRWEELRPELDAHGVQIVTVSTDTPRELRAGRRKHGLQAIMLSDRELAVTDRFGLRNQGFHSGMPGGAKALPVPTSILVDAGGIVRWVDQSENYQRRSDPERVRAALRQHLG